MDARAVAAQMLSVADRDGQCARRVDDAGAATDVREAARSLARRQGMKIRTAQIGDVAAVVLVRAAIWSDDAATMTAKLTALGPRLMQVAGIEVPASRRVAWVGEEHSNPSACAATFGCHWEELGPSLQAYDDHADGPSGVSLADGLRWGRANADRVIVQIGDKRSSAGRVPVESMPLWDG